MEIYLIRHPRPDIADDICYGQSDIPLAQGVEPDCTWVAEQFGQVLDAVYTSPLLRCSMLAEQIRASKYLNDRRLLELNFGLWEMKRWGEIDRTVLDAWMNDYPHYQIPGGECFTDLHTRTNHFIDELIDGDFRKVAIVTHAGVIRSMLVRVLDIPLASVFRVAIDYASISRLIINRHNKTTTLSFLNLSNHLAAFC